MPDATLKARGAPGTRAYLRAAARSVLATWWELARIVLPVAVLGKLLMEAGVIAALSPALAPLMALFGLPAELAFALLACAVVGIWNAAVLIFVLVPVADLSAAQMTVLGCLMLGLHALPIEQAIIARTGAGVWITTALRVLGALVFAALVHAALSATGWLAQPAAPVWVPAGAAPGWAGFARETAWTLAVMLAVLAALVVLLDALRASGLLDALNRALAPLLRLAGIRGPAVHLTAVGLLLGIAYGGGLLIAEARAGHVPRRQVLLACVFMGFAHGVIEDTALVVALGADLHTVLWARLAFALAGTALVAALLARRPA